MNHFSEFFLKNISDLKILVLGKSGQLAQQLRECKPPGCELAFAGRAEIDITDPLSIEQYVKKFSPSVIINTAAYTAVDQAEVDTLNAFLINKTAVENIARVCYENGIRLIHISTDFIFDGTKSQAYTVDDIPNPLSVYGASKLEGETALLKYQCTFFTVIRTSWLYSSYGSNFLKTMLNVMSSRELINVVDDQIACPTSALGLSQFIYTVIQLDKPAEIYNWCDLGVASWYDFAKSIYEFSLDAGLLTKAVKINPIKSNEYPSLAVRPPFSLLDVSRSLSVMQGEHWRDNLRKVVNSLVLSEKS